MNTRRLRTLLVDDEALSRRGLELRLRMAADIEIVGQCSNGREALNAIRDVKPDLVFLDIQMPGLSGFDVLAELQSFWNVEATSETTSGPSRYYRVAETGGRLGMITPLSHNFCDTCNRVRITCTGQLYMCLGQDDHVDLRAALRDDPSDTALSAALDTALAIKPRAHDFYIDQAQMARPERVTRVANDVEAIKVLIGRETVAEAGR